MNTSRPFLTAEWRYLVMANFIVDPALLRVRVPPGTELDSWNGATYASLVAFRFLNTRVKGIAIPFHRDFDEINLRFYVRRREQDEWRRGVVFVKEIVPKPAIALVARLAYNENYVALPTRHAIDISAGVRARYEWRFRGRWNRLEAAGRGAPAPLVDGSEAQFISEHYWGSCTQRNGGTKTYRVDHPAWCTWDAHAVEIDVDFAGLYGDEFARALVGKPASVFIADGSAVSVSDGIWPA